MKSFRDISIRRKLMLGILATSIIPLVIAAALVFGHERAVLRARAASDLEARGELLAVGTRATLEFNDPDRAMEMLATLRVRPELVAAGLYTADGGIFASYRGADAAAFVFPKVSAEHSGTARWTGNHLELFHPIRSGPDLVGYVYLRSDVGVLYEKLHEQGWIVLAVLVVLVAVAYWLSREFQRVISRPILDLAGTAQAVAERKDYSVRAEKHGQDEIGVLTDDFNQMLAGIQGWENALQTANEALRAENAERTQAETALRESEERLNFALKQSRTGGWSLDLVDHTAYRSLEHDRIFGYSSLLPQWTYEMFLEHVLPEDRGEVDRCFREATATRSDWSIECRIRRADGEVRWIWASGEHQSDAAGQARRMAGIVQDITERKQAQEEILRLNASLEQRVLERTAQLEAAVKELDAFSYSVSHDLRAPLRAVDGFSRIVVEDYAGQLDDEGRRMLGLIRGETRRMGRLIDDLLAFARLGRQQMEPEPIDMRELAREVFDELAALDPGRKLRLDLHPLPPALGTLSMIRQVWVNLISNAIKFTQGREPGEIEIGTRDGEDGVPVYYVKDNGAGFDMRFAGKLFGVFQRLHSAEEFPGTGVGLSLVQRIAQRHGGRAWAEGEVGRGATFYFTIPDPGNNRAKASVVGTNDGAAP